MAGQSWPSAGFLPAAPASYCFMRSTKAAPNLATTVASAYTGHADAVWPCPQHWHVWAKGHDAVTHGPRFTT